MKELKELHDRIVKTFLDIIIMAELRSGQVSGYDLITLIHDRFNLLLSSGTVYSKLYSIEREGLIEGVWAERRRVYKLTPKGDKMIESIVSAGDDTVKDLLKVLGINP